MTKNEILSQIENKLFNTNVESPSQAFIDDFNWLIECGETNATCGYKPRELLNSNKTAIDIVEHASDKQYAKKFVVLAEAIGYYKAAEDEDMEFDVWKDLESLALGKLELK